MKWLTNFKNWILDEQESLSPEEVEAAEKKSRTREKAEKFRLPGGKGDSSRSKSGDPEYLLTTKEKAEKFRLPGGKGWSSTLPSGELEYSNEKIKRIVDKERREKLRDWIRHISLTHETADQLINALESGDPNDLTEEDRKEWETYKQSSLLNSSVPSVLNRSRSSSSGYASTVRYGKRGGKYYLKRNKKGESYRKYF